MTSRVIPSSGLIVISVVDTAGSALLNDIFPPLPGWASVMIRKGIPPVGAGLVSEMVICVLTTVSLTVLLLSSVAKKTLLSLAGMVRTAVVVLREPARSPASRQLAGKPLGARSSVTVKVSSISETVSSVTTRSICASSSPTGIRTVPESRPSISPSGSWSDQARLTPLGE